MPPRASQVAHGFNPNAHFVPIKEEGTCADLY